MKKTKKDPSAAKRRVATIISLSLDVDVDKEVADAHCP